MNRFLVLLTICCLSVPLSAQAQPARASAAASTDAVDPAQQALDAWLDAFNSGERKRLEAFRDRYEPTMDVDRLLEFRGDTGGFRLVRREPSEPGTARALLQDSARALAGS